MHHCLTPSEVAFGFERLFLGKVVLTQISAS
jgi:hypothetical protein